MESKQTKITDEEAVLLLESGMSLAKIGRDYKISADCLSLRLRKKGIKIINRQNERSTNHDFFEIIDTEEKAYWLGFLFADGNVHGTTNQIELGLSMKDKSHLEKYVKALNLECEVKFREKTKSNRVTFFSKKMKQDLIDKGCVPKKSLILERPKNIPNHLNIHFIRGYFDGDGCLSIMRKNKGIDLYTPTCKMLGTKDLLTFIQETINLTSGKLIISNKKGDERCKEFGYYSSNAILFLNMIYNNANVYLDRKYLRYKTLRENNFAVQREKFFGL